MLSNQVMTQRILLINNYRLASDSLKRRLDHLGDVVVVDDAASLEKALGEDQDWDLVISEWSFGSDEGAALLSRLKPRERPVFLYTERSDVVDVGTWSIQGVQKAFTSTQRADLVLAVEDVLKKAGGSDSGSALTNPTFLLVEDSSTVRQFVKVILKSAFPESSMIEAEDGRTALAAMRSSRISLVITDLQMPGMDGLSFVQLLRNNAVLKKKPVIVLSGAVTDEARSNLASLDKVVVLGKPAQADALVNAVRSLLS
jgi:two-component system chemotaxis response regulator CheY